jgi:hypothetical protein
MSNSARLLAKHAGPYPDAVAVEGERAREFSFSENPS